MGSDEKADAPLEKEYLVSVHSGPQALCPVLSQLPLVYSVSAWS